MVGYAKASATLEAGHMDEKTKIESLLLLDAK